MNYYPTNFYSNYPQPQQQALYSYNQTQIPSYQIPAATQNPNNQIPGKIVDSQDVARVSDIPFGGYGIFPKADLSEVYIKMWNNNGTTSLVTFKPIVEGQVVKVESEDDVKEFNSKENHSECHKRHEQLMEKINELEQKISELTTSNDKVPIIKKKELSASAY